MEAAVVLAEALVTEAIDKKKIIESLVEAIKLKLSDINEHLELLTSEMRTLRRELKQLDVLRKSI